jgi:hypothetical protein
MSRLVKYIPGNIVIKQEESTVLDEVLNNFPMFWNYSWQNPTKPFCNICKTSIEKLVKLIRVLRPDPMMDCFLEASWECEKCSRLDDTWPVITAKIRR